MTEAPASVSSCDVILACPTSGGFLFSSWLSDLRYESAKQSKSDSRNQLTHIMKKCNQKVKLIAFLAVDTALEVTCVTPQILIQILRLAAALAHTYIYAVKTYTKAMNALRCCCHTFVFCLQDFNEVMYLQYCNDTDTCSQLSWPLARFSLQYGMITR